VSWKTVFDMEVIEYDDGRWQIEVNGASYDNDCTSRAEAIAEALLIAESEAL
jgi:hypothetical protein